MANNFNNNFDNNELFYQYNNITPADELENRITAMILVYGVGLSIIVYSVCNTICYKCINCRYRDEEITDEISNERNADINDNMIHNDDIHQDNVSDNNSDNNDNNSNLSDEPPPYSLIVGNSTHI